MSHEHTLNTLRLAVAAMKRSGKTPEAVRHEADDMERKGFSASADYHRTVASLMEKPA